MDVGKEVARDVRDRWLEHLVQDVRYGFRSMRRSPEFTAIAVVALALGIGANTAVFSVVDAVLLRPLPYPDPDRLVVALPIAEIPWPPPTSSTGSGRACLRAHGRGGLLDAEPDRRLDAPETVVALRLTPDILRFWSAALLVGRLFRPKEEPGKDHEVVLRYALWQRRFAGDPSVSGGPSL